MAGHGVLPPCSADRRDRAALRDIRAGFDVRSAGFEPARPDGHQHLELARIPFRHERMEPLSGADPDVPPYEGRAAAARNG
jgi:hypothetical protein